VSLNLSRKEGSPQIGPIVRAVIGNEASDVDSIASSIALAHFLHTIEKAKRFQKENSPSSSSSSCDDFVVTLPIMNLSSPSLLDLRGETRSIFPVAGISASSLVFLTPSVSSQLESLFQSNQLQLILVDHNELAETQKHWAKAVVGIIDHHVDAQKYMETTNWKKEKKQKGEEEQQKNGGGKGEGVEGKKKGKEKEKEKKNDASGDVDVEDGEKGLPPELPSIESISSIVPITNRVIYHTGSCCSLVASVLLASSPTLSSIYFTSPSFFTSSLSLIELLLSAIILDTSNLKKGGKGVDLDREVKKKLISIGMEARLKKWEGLRKDVTGLNVQQLVRKDAKVVGTGKQPDENREEEKGKNSIDIAAVDRMAAAVAAEAVQSSFSSSPSLSSSSSSSSFSSSGSFLRAIISSIPLSLSSFPVSSFRDLVDQLGRLGADESMDFVVVLTSFKDKETNQHAREMMIVRKKEDTQRLLQRLVEELKQDKKYDLRLKEKRGRR